MDAHVTREVSPPRPSLLELSVALSPWTHIKRVRLVRSQIVSNDIDAAEPSKVTFGFDAGTTLDREKELLHVRALLTVSAGDLVHITAEFAVEYAVDKVGLSFSDEIVTAFGRMNGIYNAWSYWREYVQSITTRMGLPPLTMPLMTAMSLLDYYAAKDKPTDAPQAPELQQQNSPRLGDATTL